jgi:hypothetical protein
MRLWWSIRSLSKSPRPAVQWRRSSYRFYAYGEKGPVMVAYDVSVSMPKKEAE